MLPRVREPAQEGYEGRSGQAAGADKGQGVQERPHEGPRGRLRSRSCPDGNSGSTGRLLPPRPPCRGRQPGPHPSARPASVRPARIRPSAALPDACPPHACSRPASTVPCCTQANPGPRGHAPARPPREASRWKGPSEPRPRPSHLSVLRRETRSRRQLRCEGRGRRPPQGGVQTRVWRAPRPACRKGRVGPPTVI